MGNVVYIFFSFSKNIVSLSLNNIKTEFSPSYKKRQESNRALDCPCYLQLGFTDFADSGLECADLSDKVPLSFRRWPLGTPNRSECGDRLI